MATYVLIQKFLLDIQAINSHSPLVQFDEGTQTWPGRPVSSYPVIWSGGLIEPPAAIDGDIWIP